MPDPILTPEQVAARRPRKMGYYVHSQDMDVVCDSHEALRAALAEAERDRDAALADAERLAEALELAWPFAKQGWETTPEWDRAVEAHDSALAAHRREGA